MGIGIVVGMEKRIGIEIRLKGSGHENREGNCIGNGNKKEMERRTIWGMRKEIGIGNSNGNGTENWYGNKTREGIRNGRENENGNWKERGDGNGK